MHVFSKAHHVELKRHNNATQTANQQRRLKSQSAITIKGAECVRRIQNYVAQNVAGRSLPFTAGEMALDCISATLSTIAGSKPLSEKAADVLTQAGLSDEAAAFHRFHYVSGSRNVEGPSPKKSGPDDVSPPRKRKGFSYDATP